VLRKSVGNGGVILKLSIPTTGFNVEVLEKIDSNTYLGKSDDFTIKFTSDDELNVGDAEVFVPNKKIIDGTLNIDVEFIQID
jgi:hypothetical protein